MSAARLTRWVPYRNPAGTMLAFLSVEMPSGMIVNDCKLMIGPNGRRWLALPSVKQLDRDGNPKLGKAVWSATVEFRDRNTRERFEALVLDAVRDAHPEAFVDEPA